MTTQTTTDLFEGFKALANAVTAGLGDEDADERLTFALFYIGDEIRRRIADERTLKADAMRAAIMAFEKGGLAPRDIENLEIGSSLDTEQRRTIAAIIERGAIGGVC